MKMIKPDFKNPSLEIDLKQENRMDCKISLRLCLLYVSFLLYVSGLVGVVGAQPTATAWIVSPERDQKIGGRVEMRCVATNLEEDHVVDWETQDPTVTLRWGNVTVIGNPRFMFDTKRTGNRTTTQEFSINDLQSDDDGEYVCNVNDPIPGGGHKILASITIRLRVYSSDESFPVCSPEGPITVDARTQLNLSCASDTGSPHIDISQQPPPTVFTSYQWPVIISSGLSSRSLDLIVDVSDDNLTFVCTIQSVTFYGELPVHLHSCIIGPIHVVSVFPTTKDTARLPKSTTDLASEIRGTMIIESSPLAPWIASFVVAIVLLALSCVVIIILTLQIFKQRRLISGLTEKVSVLVPKSDPYTELHPTDDSNTAYTEPVTKGSTSTRHTYYNTLDIENKKTTDDYEQPEDKYEAVGAPKNDENNI